MKIILISSRVDRVRTISLNSWAKGLLSVLLLGVPVAAGTLLGVKIADGRWQVLFDNSISDMQHQMVVQREQIEAGRAQATDKLSAMTIKLAQMRSRLVRLDALGEQLTRLASLEEGEFDFSLVPGLGGPDTKLVSETTGAMGVQEELGRLFAQLDSRLDSRESQLNILQSMLSEKKLNLERMVAGRPITKGWMSSEYGMRSDPFHGKQRWHAGVDFAGRQGADVVAVASGVVTWSGERKGYGLMVEINHSDSLVTRYAHNQKNIAELGTVVKKGELIALMGSSGRSTGPHVHFEVFKNGRTVDPASYIRRTIR